MQQREYAARLRELNAAAAAAAAGRGMRSPESLAAAEDALAFAMGTTIEPDQAEAG